MTPDTEKKGKKPDLSVALASDLFYLNAGFWFLFSMATLKRLWDDLSAPDVTMGVIAILMLGNVAALFLAGWGIRLPQGNRKKAFYFLGLAVLAVNILLTFTDQFGLFDLITLIIDVALLALLLATRSLYLSPSAGDGD